MHLMAIHCVAAENGGLIKKKKRKLMSKTVKLKAFSTDVGRPETYVFCLKASAAKSQLGSGSRRAQMADNLS